MARRPVDHTPVILWYRLLRAKPGDEHRRRRTRTRRVERDPFAVGRDPSVRDRLLWTRQNVALVSAHGIEQRDRVEARAEAFHDTNKGRDLVVQFLYFRNDVLVDMSDSRIDFRNDAALTKRWAGGK